MTKKSQVSAFGKLLGAVWWLLVCGVFLAGGTVFGWARRSSAVMKVLTGQVKPASEAFNSSSQTFLILGCDQEIYWPPNHSGKVILRQAARTDMMLVAKMDFATNEITGVSVPRDTWCKLPGERYAHKINSYYHNAPKGQEKEAAKGAVEALIGVPIDKVIVLDYVAFQRLVDMVGGVRVNVPKKMDYDDEAGNLHIHLQPGPQKLNGYQAMCYVRYRHSKTGVADTDFQRQSRQKDLLLGFKQAVFANPSNMPELANEGLRALGGALNEDEVLSLAFFAKSVRQSNIRLGVIPTKDRGNGLEIDDRKLPKVLAEYKLSSRPRVSLLQP